jgi:hypothetical protein
MSATTAAHRRFVSGSALTLESGWIHSASGIFEPAMPEFHGGAVFEELILRHTTKPELRVKPLPMFQAGLRWARDFGPWPRALDLRFVLFSSFDGWRGLLIACSAKISSRCC